MFWNCHRETLRSYQNLRPHWPETFDSDNIENSQQDNHHAKETNKNKGAQPGWQGGGRWIVNGGVHFLVNGGVHFLKGLLIKHPSRGGSSSAICLLACWLHDSTAYQKFQRGPSASCLKGAGLPRPECLSTSKPGLQPHILSLDPPSDTATYSSISNSKALLWRKNITSSCFKYKPLSR